MSASEHALTFACAGETLIGIATCPERALHVGVLIIVGGPQYRVGSHRLFVQLARGLAERGFPTMRFDYRGMGDSCGTMRSFEDVSEDIDAAIDAFRRACPGLGRIVLWGLCDAASAALLYVDGGGKIHPSGLVLANPWVRSEATMAKAQVKHYYASRLVERQFWRKFLRGEVNPVRALGGFLGAAFRAMRRSPHPSLAQRTFQERMASGLSSYTGPVLIVLSGRDLTAREFEDYASRNPALCATVASERIERCRLRDADHTFSSARWRASVESATIEWLERCVVGRER